MIQFNQGLVHVDFSGNYFGVAECQQIAETLKMNNTILGFHFEGNYGYVDQYGFLVVPGDWVKIKLNLKFKYQAYQQKLTKKTVTNNQQYK